jgi:predicted RNase H-like nuclease
LPSKKTAEGASARSALLETLGLPCAAALTQPLTCEGRRVALDDRLDALALAYLASLPEQALEHLGAGDLDPLGLPMTLLAPKASA